MIDYFIVLIILIIVSLSYLKIADQYNIVDKPNHRSSHDKITIRGGGILFYVAFVLYFITSEYETPYLFIGITLIAILSFIDDLNPLPAKLRLPFQFITAALVLVEVGFSSPIYTLLIILIVAVGFINAFNFMDGINGMTGLYSISIFLFFISFNSSESNFIDQDLLIYMILSLLIFGYYNFRTKALFFAGDVGSISLSVIVLYLICMFIQAFSAPVAILIVGVYGVDTVLTIFRRLRLRENIADAHRHHLYQLFVDSKKNSHIATSCYYAITQFFLCLIVWMTYDLAFYKQLGVVVICLSGLSALYFLLVRYFLRLSKS